MFCPQSGCQREDGRKERARRAVIGVSSGVGFGGYVLGHGYFGGHCGLFGGYLPAGQQFLQKRFGGRRKETGRQFFPGDFGNDPVGGSDRAVGGAVDAVQAITDQGQGQFEEGRGFHQPDTIFDIQFGQRLFQFRFVGRVDQVAAERDAFAFQVVYRGFHRGKRQTGRAEEAEHARFAKFLGH